VANTGLIEVPFGTTLREIVEEIGGGITNNKGELGKNEFKSVQIGGPSGGCLTKEMLDLPLDFDSLKSVGAMVGSGGLVVMNDTTCMVNIAKFFLEFTLEESCGKCTPCRVGNKRLLEMLTDITEGRGTMEHIEKLRNLATTIKETSLCGLGQTSPNPVLSTLKYFEDEYLAHIQDKKCPAGACSDLITYHITDACVGCTMCARKCPADCITGARKELHVIDTDACIKCGACEDVCKFNAVVKI
jgi:NADH:ubiquinone oxidoreductase subunit F (NADH-binding)/NAD-dependent dihydropyrimidine dehydrogenase PreA subunit